MILLNLCLKIGVNMDTKNGHIKHYYKQLNTGFFIHEMLDRESGKKLDKKVTLVIELPFKVEYRGLHKRMEGFLPHITERSYNAELRRLSLKSRKFRSYVKKLYKEDLISKPETQALIERTIRSGVWLSNEENTFKVYHV